MLVLFLIIAGALKFKPSAGSFNIKICHYFKTDNLLCGGYPCTVNAALWYPGEQAQKLQTNKPANYYTRLASASG